MSAARAAVLGAQAGGYRRRTIGRCASRSHGARFRGSRPAPISRRDAASVRTASTVSTRRSASAAEKTSGGLILITLWSGPSVLRRTPRSAARRSPASRARRGRARGSRGRGRARSRGRARAPRTSPMASCRAAARGGRASSRSPGDAGRAPGGPRRSMTSSTASPIARGHGVAAERVEVLHAVGERVGDRPRRHDRAERMAVADRLAHRDDVRDDARSSCEPQTWRAHAAEADLDLVGDGDRPDRHGRVEVGRPR